MSLILKGSGALTSVYTQEVESDVTSSTIQAIYTKVIPSDNCASPFTFIMDGDLDGSSRGYSLTQDSPTQMTVGWATSGGANSHAFTVSSATAYDVLSVYNRTAGTVTHYIDSSTPAATFSSVGAPLDATKYRLRLVSSSTAGEDVTIGDLADWINGEPDSTSLAAFNDGAYLAHAFKDSGCTNKYCFVGNDGPLATKKVFNLMRDQHALFAERIGTPEPNFGDYLPAPAVINTQISSCSPKYYDRHDAYLDYSKVCKIEWVKEGGNVKVDELIDAGYYNDKTGVFTGAPPRYSGQPSWKPFVVEWVILRDNSDVNPDIHAGTIVLEWDGNGVMGFGGGSNVVNVSANRVECTGATYFGIVSVPSGGTISNVRCYMKQNEALVSAGRIFHPKTVEYFSRYDTIRTMDMSHINEYYPASFNYTPSLAGNWNQSTPVAAQIQMAIETGNTLWMNISVFIGCGELNIDESQGATYFYNLGRSNLYLLDDAVLDSYLDAFIQTLDDLEYPIDRDIAIELDNENWNRAYPFVFSARFCDGITDQLAESEPAYTHQSNGGHGFMSARLMDRFERALIRNGRSAQVWTPIFGCQTGFVALTRYGLRGAKYYLDTRDTIFDITRYTIATTGYHNTWLNYDNGNNDVLGQTYPTKAEYFSALETAVATEEEETKIKHLEWHLDRVRRNCYEMTLSHKADAVNEFGITNPIREYEGSDHNTSLDSEWDTGVGLSDYLFAYNKNACGQAAQRLQIEIFAAQNPGGAISNFQLVGPPDARLGAWFEADSWDDLATSGKAAIWDDYIEPTGDPDAIWTAYQSSLVGDGQVTVHPTASSSTPTPTIAINTIAGNDDIDGTEDDLEVTVSGTTTNVEDGQTVTVSVNGVDYYATVGSGVWVTSIPALDVQAFDPTEVVTANVSSLDGAPATPATRNITYTLSPPTYFFRLSGAGNELYTSSGSQLVNTTIDKVVIRSAWDSETILGEYTNVAVSPAGAIDLQLDFGSNGLTFDVSMTKGTDMWQINSQTIVEVIS